MRAFLFVAAIGVASCGVQPYQLDACKKACAPRPVESCTEYKCECEKSAAASVVDAIERLAK